MRGPTAFWALLLGGIGGVFVTIAVLSPHAPDTGPPPAAPVALESIAPPAPPPTRPAPSAPSAASADEPPAGIAAAETWDAGAPEPAPPAGTLTASEAAARIRSTRPALMIIFSTGCPLSQRAFPDFVRISRAIEGRVPVVAFATDRSAARVDRFLEQHRAGFGAELLGPRQPGELSHAMGQVGISIGSRFTMPVIAVVGPRGEVLGKWEAQTDLEPVAATIERMGL